MDILRHCDNGTPIVYRKEYKPGVFGHLSPASYSVHYRGKLIGRIVPCVGGFRYVLSGGKDKGNIFPRVADVMQSLEEC